MSSYVRMPKFFYIPMSNGHHLKGLVHLYRKSVKVTYTRPPPHPNQSSLYLPPVIQSCQGFHKPLHWSMALKSPLLSLLSVQCSKNALDTFQLVSAVHVTVLTNCNPSGPYSVKRERRAAADGHRAGPVLGKYLGVRVLGVWQRTDL